MSDFIRNASDDQSLVGAFLYVFCVYSNCIVFIHWVSSSQVTQSDEAAEEGSGFGASGYGFGSGLSGWLGSGFFGSGKEETSGELDKDIATIPEATKKPKPGEDYVSYLVLNVYIPVMSVCLSTYLSTYLSISHHH